MRTRYLILLTLLTMLLASCETEIDFNGKTVRPVLVLNAISVSDSVVNVKLTSSRFFLSSVDTFEVVANASIIMTVNDTLTETLQNRGMGLYRSNYKPRPGDRVRLVATAPGFASVEAEEIYPELVSNFEVDTTLIKRDTSLWIISYYYNNYSPIQSDTLGYLCNEFYRVKARFTDNPLSENYYRLIVREEFETDSTEYRYYSGFDDVVFGAKKNSFFERTKQDPLNLFTDAFINGQTHTFQFIINNQFATEMFDSIAPPKPIRAFLHIEIQSISKSYYLYTKTLQALDGSDSFMSEPVQVYTNVSHGLGLFGTRTRQYKKFKITQTR